MYAEVFEQLGLSPNEAKIYETLIERGESTVSDIATAGNIHRRNTYDALNRLIEKGLAFQIISAKENRYNAADPDKLRELLAEKEEHLAKILPDLKRKFGVRVAPEEAYIYRGLEGQKNIWRDVLRVGGDNYVVGAKGGWFDPRLATAREAFFREANRKKIKFIQLFDAEVPAANPDFPRQFPGILEHRVLPKNYSTNSIIHTFGDYVVTYTGLKPFQMEDGTVFFVLHSKNLAESYRKWFWYMWEQSPKVASG